MANEPSLPMSPDVFEVAERGQLIVPCPLVSRGRPTFSSGAAFARPAASGAIAARGASEEPAWLALHAGVGPTKLLVSWAVGSGGSHPALGQGPTAYVIETSASSTNGRDGEWRQELSVGQNRAAARAHVIEFDGQSWVRLALAEGLVDLPLELERLDLHDASDGTEDCWLVLGDARLHALPTGARASGGGEPGWAALIHEHYPGYYPALIDETRVDESPARTLERLAELLETHAPARRVAIAHGVASIQTLEAETRALESMVSVVVERGRIPVLARPPVARGRAREAVDAFNRCVATIEQRHRLVPGPDLAGWFDAHPDQLDGGGQPTAEGRGAIARLWADALDVWYVPQ